MPAEAALITLQAEQGGWLTGVPYANSKFQIWLSTTYHKSGRELKKDEILGF